MGNCSSLKGTSRECPNSIRVLTDSGGILQFNGPKLASEILEAFPGYGIFQQSNASVPLSEEEVLTSGQFYLLPLRPKEELPADDGVSKQVQDGGVEEDVEGVEEAEPVKKSFRGASDDVENSGNGSGGGLEVLPCGGDGVWRVKLVIDTKQLEEILSEGDTLALIEMMRMAATASSTPKLQSKSLWSSRGGGWNWKPIFSNMFRTPLPITADSGM
ncbi:uncharacterized protein LOC126795285 [Argentina anserina]|uniref:uncharacterized protein LOC126795285 n=1 Tax=Argentina anserina TaxID=57926 RepID=UPI00217640B8|nr:uncharacterized protein LOC126795285 [Potentilla anserina]